MLTRDVVLAHIAAHPQGLTFTEIQRFVVEAHGLDYDEKEVINSWRVKQGDKPRYARKHRGWWCDNLCRAYGEGILVKNCVKVGTRYKVKS